MHTDEASIDLFMVNWKRRVMHWIYGDTKEGT